MGIEALLSLLVVCVANALPAIEWLTLSAKIPIPVSDIGATFVPTFANSSIDRDLIVITGGCTSNNTLIPNSTVFACSNITDSVFGFDPTTTTFRTLPPMPRPRYRHDAALVDNKLFLAGGRDITDTEIPEIDYFDPEKNEWFTLMSLPSDYWTSDNAAFGYEDYLYIVGGYQGPYYTTLDMNIRINIQTKQLTPMTSMYVARGDFRAIRYDYADDGLQVAFVLGGYTDENNFSSPLNDMEMYDIASNMWSTVESLLKARADMAIVLLDGQLLAVGGETKNGNPNDTDPGSYAVAVDDVEAYDPSHGDSAVWEIQTDFPTFRFRLTGAPWHVNRTVYFFGGQDGFDFACSCYTTSNQVITYRELNTPTITNTTIATDSSTNSSHRPSSSHGSLLFHIVLSSLLFALQLLLLLL